MHNNTTTTCSDICTINPSDLRAGHLAWNFHLTTYHNGVILRCGHQRPPHPNWEDTQTPTINKPLPTLPEAHLTSAQISSSHTSRWRLCRLHVVISSIRAPLHNSVEGPRQRQWILSRSQYGYHQQLIEDARTNMAGQQIPMRQLQQCITGIENDDWTHHQPSLPFSRHGPHHICHGERPVHTT